MAARDQPWLPHQPPLFSQGKARGRLSRGSTRPTLVAPPTSAVQPGKGPRAPLTWQHATNPGCPTNLRCSARERPEGASHVAARDQPWLPHQPPLFSQGKARGRLSRGSTRPTLVAPPTSAVQPGKGPRAPLTWQHATNPGCPTNLRCSARERPEGASHVAARDQPWLPHQPPLFSQGKARGRLSRGSTRPTLVAPPTSAVQPGKGPSSCFGSGIWNLFT